MLLSNLDILNAYDQGSIYFYDPNFEDQRGRLKQLLSHNSVDVTFGSKFWAAYDQIDHCWDSVTEKLIVEHTGLLVDLEKDYENNDEGWLVKPESWIELSKAKLSPDNFYLAHTEQFIGTTDKPFLMEREVMLKHPSTGELINQLLCEEVYLVPMFETKSTLARKGAAMHLGAGFGDFGFHGRWAMEIAPSMPLTLSVGQKVAQISFQTLSSKPTTIYESEYSKVEDWDFMESVMPRAALGEVYKFPKKRIYQ